jgi:hypothetical protein
MRNYCITIILYLSILLGFITLSHKSHAKDVGCIRASYAHLTKIISPPILDKLPYEMTRIIRKMAYNPHTKLTPQELDLFSTLGFEARIEMLKHMSRLERLSTVLQSLIPPFGIPTISQNQRWYTSLAQYLRHKAGMGLEVLIWLINPLPTRPFLYNRRVRLIYENVLNDPNTSLSKADHDFLKENELVQDLEAYRSFAIQKPILFRWSQKIAETYIGKIPSYAGLMMLLLLFSHDDELDYEEYITQLDSETSEKPTVELIFEKTAFPHSAIRIGKTVYSFGRTTLVPYPAKSYFETDLELVIPRSMTTVELNLTTEQIDALTILFQDVAWHDYYNLTLYNDCNSMMMRRIEKVTGIKMPAVIDASPTGTLNILKLYHFMDDPRIKRIQFVNLNYRKTFSNQFLTRSIDAMTTVAESKLFTILSPDIYYEQQRIQNEENIEWVSHALKSRFQEIEAEHESELLSTEPLQGFLWSLRVMKHQINSHQKKGALSKEWMLRKQDRLTEIENNAQAFIESSTYEARQSWKNANTATMRKDHITRLNALKRISDDLDTKVLAIRAILK